MLLGLQRPPRDRQALFDGSGARWWTYGEPAYEVGRASEAITSTKALAFCFMANDVGSIAGYLAVLDRGHAAVLLDPALPPAPALTLFERYAPEFVIASASGALPPIPDGEYDAASCPSPSVRIWRRRAAAAEDVHPDLAVLLSTSGSTGSPKFVRLSRQNVASNAVAIVQSLGVGADDCAVTTLPLHYAYGLSVLNSHLAAGARLALTSESVVAPRLWALMREAGCTSLAGVPYTYQILNRIGLDHFEVPSLNTLTQAGGRLDDALILKFERAMRARGGRFVVMYGQTEATARMTYLPPEYLPEKVGAVGIPIPRGTIGIDGGAGAAAAGQQGEVVYSGPNVMLGYADCRRHLSLGDELGGTLRTGDVGYLDRDGLLRIVGRNSRMAKMFGLRLNLDEVEEQLRRFGPTAVVSGDNKILIFCEEGDEPEFARRRVELAARLRIHHSALEFCRVSALPRTASGKTDYHRLQRA